MKRIFLLIFAFLTANFSIAQEIQWASSVEFQFNEFDKEFSAQQALGIPDAPSGVISKKAFRLRSEHEYGTLILNFENPQEISQLVIMESHAPGSISAIFFYDPEGNKYPAYTSEPIDLQIKSRAFLLNFPKTSYKVRQVELNINTIETGVWNQIDAVGIAHFENVGLMESALKKVSSFPIDISVAFAGERERLDDKINSAYDETKPLISPDGNFLYMSRQYHPENERGVKDIQDIYVSMKIDDQWYLPDNMGKPLNDKEANGLSSVTPDGNRLLLFNIYKKNGTKDEGASISKKTKKGWSFPEPLEIEDFYNKSQYVDYYLSGNGKTLLLAVEREDSYGDQDLYVSFLQKNKKWSVPLNLGPVVNSAFAEFSPFLAADDKTIYFASYGHDGFGEADIYFTKRLDDSWQNWSVPKNMGPKVNSPYYDAYYTTTAQGDYAYFVSTFEGNAGSKDIFRIQLPKEAKPEPVALISGKVFNAKTGEPIYADILFETLSNGQEIGNAQSDPTDGDYKIVLPRGQKYGFLAKADGYMSVNENIDLTTIDQYQEVSRDLYLVPIEVGQKVQLQNLFFKQSSDELLVESYPELQRLANFLEENPSVEIRLEGHTDNRGIARANLELSEKRVKTVKEFLEAKGINTSRIEMKGYGGTKPIINNGSEENRRKNRRVEVVITKY